MDLLGNRVLVRREPEAKSEGFQAVKAVDDFTSRGVIAGIGDEVDTVRQGRRIEVGQTVVFARFSPDTHTVQVDGEDMKSVLVSDIIAIVHD